MEGKEDGKEEGVEPQLGVGRQQGEGELQQYRKEGVDGGKRVMLIKN